MDRKKKKILFITVPVILVIIVAAVIFFAVGKGHRVIKVKSFVGQVSLERDSSDKEMVEGMNLKSKDTVTTGEDGLVELLVDEDKHIVAEANTSFIITSSGNEKSGKLKIELLYGTSLIEIENKLSGDSSVEVETPNATLSVRGTTFETTYSEDENTTKVKVSDGVVSVETDKETVSVEAGNMATVKDDEIKISPLPIEYENEIAFFKEFDYQGTDYTVIVRINVKKLVGWSCDSYTFEKDGIKLEYDLFTKDQLDELIEGKEAAGHIKATDYKKNDDETTIICLTYNYDGDEKLYQYFKEVEDERYISIAVSDENNKETSEETTIDTFLPLTNECYYYRYYTMQPTE